MKRITALLMVFLAVMGLGLVGCQEDNEMSRNETRLHSTPDDRPSPPRNTWADMYYDIRD